MHRSLKPSCCTASRQVHIENNPNIATTLAVEPLHTINDESGVYHGKEKMIYLEGGTFLMGTEDREGFSKDGEGPVREVTVSPFYMDSYAVSNEKFRRFVEATGYVTDAERFGWSFVFHLFVSEISARRVELVAQTTPWWWNVEGASWKRPEGVDYDITHRMDHPVVHVSWKDASAYCKWAETRLPTEAEWEFAGRGGLVQKRYPWGDELKPGGEHRCNIWQGKFPVKNNASDGFAGTAPIHSFPPNNFGFYNMSGNVWEWCSDWFSPDYHLHATRVNPKGPLTGNTRVLRGGSYLCHKSYCNRYRIAARSANTPDSSSGNMGFRCAAKFDWSEER